MMFIMFTYCLHSSAALSIRSAALDEKNVGEDMLRSKPVALTCWMAAKDVHKVDGYAAHNYRSLCLLKILCTHDAALTSCSRLGQESRSSEHESKLEQQRTSSLHLSSLTTSL